MTADPKARARVGLAACALVVGLAGCSGDAPGPAPADDPRAAPSGAATSPTAAPPSEWRRAEPAAAGFDAGRLDSLAAQARRAGSSCFAVVRKGRLVGEWHWQGTQPTTAREVFSVTKSVTSTLVGIAQAAGDLDIDDRASTYLPAWRETASADVTVRNLLANDSGREWSPQSDYVELLQAGDRTGYAVGLGQEERPGAVWVYNNAAIQTLDLVLHAATGEETATFAERRLFGPLGMTQTRMTPDASGRSTNTFFGLQSTCLDLARFGRLFAQRGRWDGEQVVPRAWVRDAVGAPSQRLNAAYGLLWWLNRSGSLREPLNEADPQEPPAVSAYGRLVPGAPGRLYAAQGLGGQVVLVDPGTRTVVVRLGALQQDDARPYTFADAARVVTWALTGP